MLTLAGFDDPQAVAEALSVRRGPHVRHGVDVLDLADQPTDETLRFESWSVTWAYRAPDRVVGQDENGVAQVRRSASMTIPAGQAVNLNARRLRLWSEWLLLDGTWARFPLGIFVVTNPGAVVVDENGRATQTLTLADKSYLWANTLLTEPVHLEPGTPALTFVRNRLTTRFGETRFALAGSDALLTEPRTVEAGQSELELCSRALEAVAFDQLTVDVDGAASSQALAVLAGRGPEITYGAGQGKVLEAGQVEPLLPTLPNVVRFSARQGPSLGNVEGNGLETRRNQSTGPASIDARGGVEVELRVDVDVDDAAALKAVADADCQRYFAGGGLRWSGHVALNPRAGDRDVIALALPRYGLTNVVFHVTEWTYLGRPITSPEAVLMPITAEARVVL